MSWLKKKLGIQKSIGKNTIVGQALGFDKKKAQPTVQPAVQPMPVAQGVQDPGYRPGKAGVTMGRAFAYAEGGKVKGKPVAKSPMKKSPPKPAPRKPSGRGR